MATVVLAAYQVPVQVVATISIDAFGNTVTGVQSTVVASNSTVTPLGAAGVFTGTSVDVTRYASVNVSVFTSHASATDGLSIQQSSDGANWDVTDTYTVPAMSAGGGKTYSVQVVAMFMRVVYTNGGTLQTAFRLQSIIKPGVNPTSSVRTMDAYSNENDMQQAQGFGMVFNGTTWDRLRSTPYQVSQTPLIAGSGNVANATAAATLTGTASTTVYLSGFEITGSGSTVGLPVTVTVAGLLGGTRSYTYVFQAGALIANTPLSVQFTPPLPASAINTPIVVSCPAGGTGATNNTAIAHGFYQ